MKRKFELDWLIVGFTGVTAFILALIGFNEYFVTNGIERNFRDLIYFSIRIFGMELVDEYVSPLPLTLELARWLAPGVLIYTAAKGIIYLVRREFRMMRIKFYKNHVIVSGINNRSAYLINDLLNNNEKVVVVSDEYSDADKELIERNGGLVLTGNIGEADIQVQVAVSKAKHIIFIENNDENNITASISVFHLLNKIGNKTKPVLYAHISGYLKLNELREINLFENLKNNNRSETLCDIRIFSENERAARVIFNKFAPDVFRPVISQSEPAINIVIIGDGELTKSLVIQMARMCHYSNFENINISLFYDDEKLPLKLQHSFPRINTLVNLKVHQVDFDTFEAKELTTIHSQQSIDAVYITCGSDEQTLKVLNILSKVEFGKSIDAVISLHNPEGILNKWFGKDTIGDVNIHKYNITGDTFTGESIISEQIDELAKIIHDDYFSKIMKAGKLNRTKESHREWAFLPEEFKNQNRLQADHIPVKLRAIGCTTVPADDKTAEFNFTENAQIVETLAKMEHNRWAAHLILNGWKYGITRDDKKKIHTDLIPYEELSEDIKQYDRNTILNIRPLLSRLNLKVIKNNGQ